VLHYSLQLIAPPMGNGAMGLRNTLGFSIGADISAWLILLSHKARHTSIYPWNIILHLVSYFSSLLPLQLFGTPFLWPCAVVYPLTVFGANSKPSSITLLSGLLNAPPHPAPQIRRVSHWHCAFYKFTYLLTYLRCWLSSLLLTAIWG